MTEDAFLRLDRYCRGVNYKGWDVFDGLNSQLFRCSGLCKSELLRLSWIQLFKRSPINLRRITLVPKSWNAKGLGLFASGLFALKRHDEAKRLLDKLLTMRCEGYSGNCWGYNFPWQARAFYVPEGKPNLVTTVFVANAFLDYYDRTSETDAFLVAEGCCDFILDSLILFEDDDKLCFGYIPGEKARVHNANMLGAALLARVGAQNGNNIFFEKSEKAIAYSVFALQEDYSWPYGELHRHRFVDNFHTGFNLVALKNWMTYTGEHRWQDELSKAYGYYLGTFWQDDGCPKYYNNFLYPIDIHCSAQGIVTCVKLKEFDDRSIPLAEKITRWAIKNMQSQDGYFFYQKTKWYTNRIPYIRWSQAWMFYALAHLFAAQEK